MSTHRRLIVSIVTTVAGLFILQAGFFLGLTALFGIDREEFSYFLTVLLMVHAALLIFLVAMRDSFHVVPSRRPLERINFTNVLTLTRISSTPTILYLLILAENYPVTTIIVFFTALVFLTDLLDGRISRRTGQITRVGQYLDSMSDYAVLIAVSIAFVHYALIARWFFRLVMVRLLFQWVAMGLLLIVRGYVEPTTTIWGKVSVFATMTLYSVALLKLIPQTERVVGVLFPALQYAAAGIVAFSVLEKGYMLAVELRHAGRDQSRNP